MLIAVTVCFPPQLCEFGHTALGRSRSRGVLQWTVDPAGQERREHMMRGTVLLMVMVLVSSEEPKREQKKLQIGIKKRIEDCAIKSRRGDLLHMHYTGTLEDGTEFDSSIPRGQPLTFTLGSGQVIKGWDQGLIGMCEGERRKLVIPPDLGYGSSGAPPKIPGGATLVFEVDLVKIERKEEL